MKISFSYFATKTFLKKPASRDEAFKKYVEKGPLSLSSRRKDILAMDL
jgi:hypothetical protein